MMFRSRIAQIAILAAGSAFALITATAGDSAHGEGSLDASYTISFARIPVGEITATAVFGENEYAMSARARAGGVLKALLVDGEASFSTQGTIKSGHPVPTTFTSKIVSNIETSDVTMVFDEGRSMQAACSSSDPDRECRWDRRGVSNVGSRDRHWASGSAGCDHHREPRTDRRARCAPARAGDLPIPLFCRRGG